MIKDNIKLAEKYLYGYENIDVDIKKGLEILESEGKKGNFLAYYELGDFILSNEVSNYSNVDAKNYLKEAAKHGIKDARIKLYEIYSNNNYGLLNYRGAIYWLMKSKIYTPTIFSNFQRIIDYMFQTSKFNELKLEKYLSDLNTYYINTNFYDYRNIILEYACYTINEVAIIKLQNAKTLQLVKEVLNFIDFSLSQFINYQVKEYILNPTRNMCFSMIGNRIIKNANCINDLIDAKNYYLKISDGESFKQKNLDKVYSLLCNAYLFGDYNTEIDEVDALEYYEKIYNKTEEISKKVDSYLIKQFNYHYKNNRLISALKYLELLSFHTPEQANLKMKIKGQIDEELNLERKTKINKYIPDFNPDSMYFEELNDKIIDLEKNCIYYFIDYYKTEIVRKSNNQYIKRNHDLILNLKDPTHFSSIDPFVYFKKIIEKYIKGTNKVWYICTVPGHDQINGFENRMTKLLEKVNFTSNFKRSYNLIRKTQITDPKHLGGVRDWKIDLKSLGLDSSFDYHEKNFIIFDDVTTSGSSLKAVKKLLKSAGVKKVVCIALAKTKGDN